MNEKQTSEMQCKKGSYRQFPIWEAGNRDKSLYGIFAIEERPRFHETSVSELGFRLRVSNRMDIHHVATFHDLLIKTPRELLSYECLGKKSLHEIQDKCYEIKKIQEKE